MLIGCRFKTFVDSDPVSESGSGSKGKENKEQARPIIVWLRTIIWICLTEMSASALLSQSVWKKCLPLRYYLNLSERNVCLCAAIISICLKEMSASALLLSQSVWKKCLLLRYYLNLSDLPLRYYLNLSERNVCLCAAIISICLKEMSASALLSQSVWSASAILSQSVWKKCLPLRCYYFNLSERNVCLCAIISICLKEMSASALLSPSV
jgi:hypothetical protein